MLDFITKLCFLCIPSKIIISWCYYFEIYDTVVSYFNVHKAYAKYREIFDSGSPICLKQKINQIIIPQRLTDFKHGNCM